MADPRPYKKLLRLVMRAFYPGPCPPKHHQDEADEMARSKLAKIDTTGLGIVLVEYLLEREWVPEEQIASDLGQHHKIVRRALKFLEHEHIVMGEHRRETKRMQKTDVVKAVTATKAQQLAEATGAAKEGGDDDEDAVQKQHTYSYWAVDYPRMYDMVQLRLFVMRRLIKDEVDAREVLAKYMCKAPQCGREYTSFDMPDLITPDGTLCCTMCTGVVEQVLATGQTGDDEQRKERRKRLQQLLVDMEDQLKPVADLVLALRNAAVPHHGALIDWAKVQQAKLVGGGAGAGAGEGAVRVKLAGGVTQLTEAGGAAKSAAYQEKIVMIDLGDKDAGGAGTSTAGGAAAAGKSSGAGAAGKGGVGKAPALQPFFLKSKEAEAAHATAATHAPGAASAAAAAADTKPEHDDYAKEMLARLAGGQQQVAAGSPDFAGPPAKRVKTEEAPKQEQPAPAAAAGEDEEWEDI